MSVYTKWYKKFYWFEYNKYLWVKKCTEPNTFYHNTRFSAVLELIGVAYADEIKGTNSALNKGTRMLKKHCEKELYDGITNRQIRALCGSSTKILKKGYWYKYPCATKEIIIGMIELLEKKSLVQSSILCSDAKRLKLAEPAYSMLLVGKYIKALKEFIVQIDDNDERYAGQPEMQYSKNRREDYEAAIEDIERIEDRTINC